VKFDFLKSAQVLELLKRYCIQLGLGLPQPDEMALEVECAVKEMATPAIGFVLKHAKARPSSSSYFGASLSS
jgi:hypothetical protein